MIRAFAVILTLIASPVAADTAVLAFEFDGDDGVEAICATVDDLRAEVTTDYYGEPAVSVRLQSKYDQRFAALTLRHVGKTGRILVCGDIVSAPMIMGQIPEASFIITGAFTTAEAEALVAKLEGLGCQPKPGS